MIQSLINKEELPINTLDLRELSLQWKVMKAMGYKSLFDPDFRRELRNPLRKLLYYTIVVEEERQDRLFFEKVLSAVSDKIGYFSDPELYHKVKDAEARAKVAENDGDNQYVAEIQKKSEEMERAYRPMSDKDRQESLAILKV